MRLSPQAQTIVDSIVNVGGGTDRQLSNRLGIPYPSVRRARREAEKAGVIRMDYDSQGPLRWIPEAQGASL